MKVGSIGPGCVGSREKEVILSFKHVGISTFNDVEPILYNISGFVEKGGITAVMGASASGKSLLMKTLAGQAQNIHITGELLMDGVDVHSADIWKAVGFVPQEDMLMGELSARQMLRNVAMMKKNKNASLIDTDVDHLLTALAIDNIADNPIGTVFVSGLSGGQRKRVNIGTALISPPPILFLDEPTSGLDASIALEVL
eukprot:gene3089-6061_t